MNNNPQPFLRFQFPEADFETNQDLCNEQVSGSDRPYTSQGHVARKYELAVKGVQKQFSHLSEEDIFYPPHEMFDAALARQIALHIMHFELSVPKRRLVIELERSREMLNRALKTIEARKEKPEFENTYRNIADEVQSAIDEEGQ